MVDFKKIIYPTLLLVIFGYNLGSNDIYHFKVSIFYKFDKTLFSNDFLISELSNNTFYERFFYDFLISSFLNFFSFELINYLIYFIYLIILYFAVITFGSLEEINVKNKELFLLVFFSFSLGSLGNYNFPYNQPSPGQISFALSIIAFSYLKKGNNIRSLLFYSASILFHPVYFILVTFYLTIFLSKKLSIKNYNFNFYILLLIAFAFWFLLYKNLFFANITSSISSEFTFTEILKFRSPWHFDPLKYSYYEYFGFIFSILFILNSNLKTYLKRNYLIIQFLIIIYILGLIFFTEIFYSLQFFRLGLLNNLIVSSVIANNISDKYNNRTPHLVSAIIISPALFISQNIKVLASCIFLLILFNNLKIKVNILLTFFIAIFYFLQFEFETKIFIYLFLHIIVTFFIDRNSNVKFLNRETTVKSYLITFILLFIFENSYIKSDYLMTLFYIGIGIGIFVFLNEFTKSINNYLKVALSSVIIFSLCLPIISSFSNTKIQTYFDALNFHFKPSHFQVSEINCENKTIELYNWAYYCTNIEDSFLIPPDLTFFRGVTSRSVFVDFKSQGQNKNSLFNWMNRIQLVTDLDKNEIKTNVNLRKKYNSMPHQKLIDTASLYGYTYVLFTEEQVEENSLQNDPLFINKSLNIGSDIFFAYKVNN